MKAKILKSFKYGDNVITEGDIVNVFDWSFGGDGKVDVTIAGASNETGSFDLFGGEYELIEEGNEILKWRLKRLRNYSKLVTREIRLILSNIYGSQR